MIMASDEAASWLMNASWAALKTGGSRTVLTGHARSAAQDAMLTAGVALDRLDDRQHADRGRPGVQPVAA